MPVHLAVIGLLELVQCHCYISIPSIPAPSQVRTLGSPPCQRGRSASMPTRDRRTKSELPLARCKMDGHHPTRHVCRVGVKCWCSLITEPCRRYLLKISRLSAKRWRLNSRRRLGLTAAASFLRISGPPIRQWLTLMAARSIWVLNSCHTTACERCPSPVGTESVSKFSNLRAILRRLVFAYCKIPTYDPSLSGRTSF